MTLNSPIEEFENQDLYEHYRFVVDKGQSPLRVDKFLTNFIENSTRNKIQIAAKSGSILVNNAIVKSNYKVKPDDVISIVLAFPPREKELFPEDITLDIIYEDQDLLVVNKQANLVVHPGFSNFSGTLVNGLLHHFNNLPKGTNIDRPGLVHRLDKNTTGLMVVAKTDFAMSHLAKQFFDRSVNRTYNALVWGDLKNTNGTITGYIGRSKKNRKVMDVFLDEDKGKHSVTHYKVLKRFRYVTLIECKLETGRTHQIRAHFKYFKHPLFNDEAYGGNQILRGTTFTKYKQFVKNCFDIIKRQCLHAKTIEFQHPITKETMQFDSELPKDFQEILKKWDNYISNS